MSAPYQIAWQGPEGSRIVLDEDGVRLDLRSCDGMEESALRELITIVTEVEEGRTGGHFPPPTVASREQVRAMSDDSRAAYLAKRASRAVREALS